jgi:hypothetical protein
LLALSKPLLAVMFFWMGRYPTLPYPTLPYPTATVSSVVLPNATSQSTDVLTSVTSSTGQQTQHVGSVGYGGGTNSSKAPEAGILLLR